MQRSVHLVFPVDELQVDGGSRAEQAMGFGLDVGSERRRANVEPLNELHKEKKNRRQSDGVTHLIVMHCLRGHL